MKKVLAVIGAMVALSWGAAGYAWPTAGGHGGDKPEMGMGMMHGGLDLSVEQKEKIKALMKGQQAEMAPLRDALKARIDELRVLLDKKASDAELTAKLGEITAARDAMQAARKKWMDKYSEVLTPRQRAEMAVEMEGNGGMRGKMGARKAGGHHGGGSGGEGAGKE